VASKILVIGGAAVDLSFVASRDVILKESNIASQRTTSAGGVGRNMAESIARLSSDSRIVFASVVGNDDDGVQLKRSLQSVGVNVDHVLVSPLHATATYCSFLSRNGQLECAMASMSIFDSVSKPFELGPVSPSVVLFDCNFSSEFMLRQIQALLSLNKHLHVWVEPTSQSKAARCVASLKAGLVYGIAPNEAEFDELQRLTNGTLLELVHVVVKKKGAKGVEVFCKNCPSQSFPAPKVEEVWGEKKEKECKGCLMVCSAQIKSVTGAGDALLASIIVLIYERKLSDFAEIIPLASRAAAAVLSSLNSVSQTLSPNLLD
jgi:pseudouridine kinase